MTQAEIVAMAKEAGFEWDSLGLRDRFCFERFAALVAAKEREACGKARAGKPRELPVCGSGSLHSEQQFCFEKGFREGAAAVRAAIRARGTKEGV